MKTSSKHTAHTQFCTIWLANVHGPVHYALCMPSCLPCQHSKASYSRISVFQVIKTAPGDYCPQSLVLPTHAYAYSLETSNSLKTTEVCFSPVKLVFSFHLQQSRVSPVFTRHEIMY